MILENDTIKLRAVEPADIELLYQWENDPGLWQVSENNTPFSRFDIERYIMSEGDIYANKQLRLMIDNKVEGITIGAVDLFDFNPEHNRAGVGILIYAAENRRKGYAADALTLLINYAFNILNLHLLYCNISANNLNSINLFKKIGFEVCGIKKEWNNIAGKREDELILQLIRK